MALPKSPVSWPITGGIATKNAPIMLAPPAHLVLDNARQERLNEWRTRSGFGLDANDDLPGSNPPVTAIEAPWGGLVALTQQTDAATAGRIYTPDSLPRWHSPPLNAVTHQQACSQLTPGVWSRKPVAPMTGPPSAWSVAEGGGLRLTAWWSRFANSGVQVSFTSTDGASLFYSPSIGTATAVRGRCVYSSTANMLVLFIVDPASGAIAAYRWDCATGLPIGAVTVPAPTVCVTDAYNVGDGAASYMDAIYYGGTTITVAYRNQTGGGDWSSFEFNPATAAVTANVDHAVDASNCISLLADPDGSGTRYVAISGAGPTLKVIRFSSAGAVLTTDTVAAIDVFNVAGVAYQSTTGTPGWMVVYRPNGTTMSAVKRRGGVTSAVKLLVPAGFTGGFGLASNAWREPATDAMRYLLYLTDSTGGNYVQRNFYEMALEYENAADVIYNYWPEPQARILPLNAGAGYEERGAIPQVQQTGADQFVTCLPRVSSFDDPANVLQFNYSMDEWDVQYLNGLTYANQNLGSGTQTEQCAYLLAGSLLQTATGLLLCAHGASALPFVPGLTPSTGGGAGLTLLALYSYFVTVDTYDENGNVWRSAPCSAVSITLTGTNNNITVVAQNTPFENATRRRTVKFWRTKGNGSVFFLAHMVTDTIANTVSISWLDTVVDTSLAQAFSGEVQATITPAFSHVVEFGGRLWGSMRDFPDRVMFSKPIQPGILPEFPATFLVNGLTDQFGDITGLTAMDDRVVAMKSRALYISGGGNVGNDGSGAFPEFTRISSESGNIVGGKFLSTGAEVYFTSSGGIFRVTRAQNVDFVGSSIDLYLSMPLLQSPETVIGMVLSPSKNEVRIQTTNFRFVHDRIFNLWIRDTGGMSNGSIVMTKLLGGSTQIMLTSNGHLWRESADGVSPSDPTATYQGLIRSPSIRPTDVGGWMRLYKARAYGTVTTPGTVTGAVLSIFFNDDDTIVETFTPTGNIAATAGLLRIEARPVRQKCTSFSLQLQLPVSDATVRLEEWWTLVGPKAGAPSSLLADRWT